MPSISDAPGRLDHVKAGGYSPVYTNDKCQWSANYNNNSNVTSDVPSNDILMQSEAAEWLDIASKTAAAPHYSSGRQHTLLSDILGTGSGPHEWDNSNTNGSSSGHFHHDPMELDDDDAAVDYHSDKSSFSVATPPTLTTGTSVDAGGEPESDDDVQMAGSPQSPHPQNVWPTIHDNQPPLLNQSIESFNSAASSTSSSSSSSSGSYGSSSVSSSSSSSSASPSDASVSSPATTTSSVQSGTESGRGSSNASTPHRSSSPHGPRPRILKAPEETNEVRKMGACYRCRISRVKCDTDLICHKCMVPVSKPGTEFISQTCIREEPSKVGGVAASRWSWKDSRRFSPRRDNFNKDERVKLHVRFPIENPTSKNQPNTGPYLEITASPFVDPTRDNNQWGTQKQLLGIVPNEGPRDEHLYAWVKRQISASTDKPDFESRLERLHLDYVRDGCLNRAVGFDEKAVASMKQKPLSPAPSRNINTQNELLKNILSMRCMWKVWSCDKFEITLAENGSPLPRGCDVSAIQDHLHSAAEQALSSLEKTILRDMDRYLSPSDIKEDRPVLRSAMNVALWVILWQMILLYRQSVIRTLVQQALDQKEANAAPFVPGMNSWNYKRHKFHDITERLFNGVVVMYSELFRTRKVLEGLRDARGDAFGNDPVLFEDFHETWAARETFYRSVERNKQSPDPLLASLVVVKERAGFKKGRGHK